jgi:inward rectifier potassium channel
MFSFQTSSTLGYGYLLPKTTFANILVVFDSLSGLLYVALVTGLIFFKIF